MNNATHSQDHLTCTACNRTTALNIFPLFIVTGASGTGKTTIVAELRKQLPECIIFDKDLLLASFNERFYNNWLLIAHSIAQGGRYTIICGTITPQDLASCPERELIGTLHFLNLHCNDEVRAQRLRARPVWRGCTDEWIENQRQFARWQLDNAAIAYNPPMQTVDTSNKTVEEAGREIASRVLTVIDGQPKREPSPFY